MSVCSKHRQQGRSSCSCFIARRPLSDGYGGPDVSGLSEAAFDALATPHESPSSNPSSNPSYTPNDSGPSGGNGD